MVELKRVDLFQWFKFHFVLFLFVFALLSIPGSIASYSTMQEAGEGIHLLPFIALVIMAIVVCAFLVALVHCFLALLYNIVAKITGGLRVELQGREKNNPLS